MNYKYKRIVSLVFLILSSLILTFFVTACNNINTEKSFKISSVLTDAVVDIGDTIEIPKGNLKDNLGNDINQLVMLFVYDPVGAIRASSATKIKFTIVGEWKVVYYSENAEDFTVIITCKDISPPKMEVKDYTRWAFVNTQVFLPKLTLHDESGIDYIKSSLNMFYLQDDNWVKYSYNDIINSFTPTDTGFYKFVLNAVDIKGNSKEYEYTIMITEENWTLPNLSQGYLADFNSDIYSYLISEKAVCGGGWWYGFNEPESEYIEDITGSIDGATKIVLYRGANGAALRLQIPPVQIDNFDYNNLIIRFKNDNVTHTFINDNFDTENVSIISEADENGWRLMSIPLSVLDGNASNLKSIEFLLSYSMSEKETFYFDFIKVANTLSVPETFEYFDRLLTWNEIENASYYVISINGTEYVVYDNFYEIPEGNYVIKVKSIGDKTNWFNSDYSNVFTTFILDEGYIAKFNSTVYTHLVGHNVYGGGWWNGASEPVAEHILSGVTDAVNGDSLKVTVTGSVNGTAGIRLLFPTPEEGSLSGSFIVFRYKGVDRPYVINGSWESDIPAHLSVTTDESGWKIATIPLWMTGNSLYGLQSMDFLMNIASGTTHEIYFDYVKGAYKLETPINLAYTDGLLSWSAVDNASSYVVNVNGTEYAGITDTSYQLSAGEYVLKVKAIGDKITYFDSDYSSEKAVLIQPQGYIVDYNSDIYASMVGHNVYGGAWWNGASAPVSQYISSGVTGAENGDALKVTVTGSAHGTAGIRLLFPTPEEGSLSGSSIVFRYKGIERPRVINGSWELDIPVHISVTTDENGWNTAIIPLWMTGNSLYGLQSMDFLINIASGTTYDMYFDYVKEFAN